MMRIEALILAFSLSVLAAIANAQSVQCGSRAAIAARLLGQYSEVPAVTLTSEGAVIEIWANMSTATWTILRIGVADPTQACVVASGTGIVGGPRPTAPVAPSGAPL